MPKDGIETEVGGPTFPPRGLAPRLTTVATFPEKYFLENLAVRRDNSMLVTVFSNGELWYVPPCDGSVEVAPSLIHTFKDAPPLNLVEVEPDLFVVHTSNIFTTHESALHRLDLRGWSPGRPVRPERIFDFPETVRGLNGSCPIAPGVILIADCLAGLIWRADIGPDARSATARVWLAHGSMAFEPHGIMPDQPGVNGIRHAAAGGYVYYTSTTQRLFMRVRVEADTFEAVGEPELVAAGRMADDLFLDEAGGVAYLCTHLQHTIDVVSLDPARNRDAVHHVVAGNPFADPLVGPSSGAWGRGSGEHGRVAFVTTDGGTKRPPPDGRVRPAKLLRLELRPAGAA